MSWLPIETAPKDGTPILLLSIPDEIEGEVRAASVALGHWHPDGSSWVSSDAADEVYELRRTGVWFSGGGWFQPDEVSHWMPLPQPPDASPVPTTTVTSNVSVSP